MLLTADAPIGDYKVLSLGSFIVNSRAFYITIFVFSLVLLCPLMCFKDSYPTNLILLLLWTATISFSVASACVVVSCDPMIQTKTGALLPNSLYTGSGQLYKGAFYCAVGTESYARGTFCVLTALGITAAVFIVLTAFTLLSKWDFSFLGYGLGVALGILITWGFLMMIFGGSAHIQYLYSLAGALLFSLYIIFDTWKVSAKYTPDDYIPACIDLFLDILNLFLFILELLSDRRR
mmetsp:Transcript_8006/g.24062  ORF Transcript_8006/g.24062 Transcript_8006/m.24062 type:complete len:235 (-) Transcript_8006:147-851(-)